MLRILAGLNTDRGIEIESTLKHKDVITFTSYVLENYLEGEREDHLPRRHALEINDGIMFGFRKVQPGEQYPDSELRFRLNTVPITGKVLLKNLNTNASLSLDIKIKSEADEKMKDVMKIVALGQLSIYGPVILPRKYNPVLSSLDYESAFVWTELQPNGQVKLHTEIEIE